MGWDHQERRKRLAPVGEYRPEVYRVTVHDTFEQLRLSSAALALCNRADVPGFFLFAAHYVLRHHRELRHHRRAFRRGEREILSAVRAPIGPEHLEPESERGRRRRDALQTFEGWAWAELAPSAVRHVTEQA